MKLQLRDYQVECLNAVVDSFSIGVNKQLIVLPTGSGKTVVMAAIAKHFNKKTILLAHREELITQAVEKFMMFWPEVDIGVCMGDRYEMDNQIIVGSIQSCSRPKRLEKLKEKGFEVVLVDEAHHATSESYREVISGLGFDVDQEKLLIGVTATPQRADNYGLGNIFDQVTFSRSIATMIRAGYLAPVIGRKILTNLSFEKLSIQNGDFAINELAELVNTSERNDFVVQKFKEYAIGRKAIAFCVDVAHCHALANAFKAQGIKCQSIWGDMSSDDRRSSLEAFKHGKIQVLTSCGVLTEGYDESSIECIAMTRPTKSQPLYIQSIGRGLRLHPGKADCLVLDFSDKGHNLDFTLSLSNIIPEIELIKEKDDIELEKVEADEIDRSSKITVLQRFDGEFDILGSAKFIWAPLGDGEWSLLDDDRSEIVLKQENSGFIASLYYQDGKEVSIVKTPLPLEYCQGVCEDFARKHLKVSFADINKPWMKTMSLATQGQMEYLKKKNAWQDGYTKPQASLKIREVVALENKKRRLLNNEPITVNQRYLLEKNGIDTKNMSKLSAMKAISNLKQRKVVYG